MATASESQNQPLLAALRSSDIQFAVAVICMIFMMFIPLPPVLLDLLLSVSITIAVLVLLVAIYIHEPLDFSTFPTFLLLATFFRLALNVATTRNILLNGANGEVSRVISTFGDFVVGGNYFVGFVIFLILVIINFLVITKGAGRVAEVGARFTLDAMPGKQMSIDADLNAGIIDREEARRRRNKIENEADFYGSMDGASKFVRGDAIAGLIITAINIVVGLVVGVMQYDMGFSESARVYTLLTVGDGLVSQIPSIVISVAAGIVVTRASGDAGLSTALSSQMFFHSKALYLCAFLLAAMSMIPGLPFISFALLATTAFFLARFSQAETARRTSLAKSKEREAEAATKKKEDSIESLLHLDSLTLEVGVGLIPLVDTAQNGEVLERIVSTRKQFAQDMGIIVPMVMVRDNIQLKPGEYQILLKGNVIARGHLVSDHELAMAPEDIVDPVEGIATKEPAYGLDAVWIKPSQRDEASFRGYTVVNCATVIVTHLTKLIGDNAHELLGRQEVQNLVDGLKERSPKVVEEVLGAEGISLGDVVKVLHNLLLEGVSIRDLLSIFETLADHAKAIKHPDALTRYVRRALGRGIVRKYLGDDGKLNVCNIDRATEDLISSGISHFDDGSTALNLDPQIAQSILNRLGESLKAFETIGTTPVIICGAQIRWEFRKLVNYFIPGTVALSYDEVPSDIRLNSVGTIKI